MKRIALAAAGAAVIGITACSHTAAPTASHASHRTVSVPVSCKHQYDTWESGQGKRIVEALHAVSVAGKSRHPHALTIALKKAKATVAKAPSHPMPACADPRGYWDVLLMHVNGAVASRNSSSSLRAAMKGIPQIEHNLTMEVKRATM